MDRGAARLSGGGAMRRTSRREFVRTMGAGAIGLLAAACAPRTGAPGPQADSGTASGLVSARPTTTVKITDTQITSAAGSYIADAKGYFREEGIQAEFLVMGSADTIPAVVSGTADVAGAAINAALFNALARGLPLKIVADQGGSLPNASAGA